ncbi:TetR/AcrR family transcriptional regulator [Gordonia sp. SCSIO 19800]|uniref:TetR/AcrR family transcriptional regulator n=1 Tax=Gordonia sp. SCSIO 19800 TaxID=2826926 RepID=UPI001B829944|nr:TetR/AcrR family transcriptional regulator [Gordonia sp. SCSIO 19800]MBR7194383.1 TetR/AcrR family transcriptional regulator [Gordonia sp. SCSIO 19800]
MTDTSHVAPASLTRGEHRAEQIVRAATLLFQDLGYQNVSIDQIGSAVGLTGPAMYRHFKGKYAILVQALRSQVALVEELTDRADAEGTTPQERLDLFLDGLSDITANGDEATLWRREQRHLRDADRAEFQEDFRKNRDRIAEKIAAVRPDTTKKDRELLGFAVLTMYSNTPSIRGGLPPERLIAIQQAVAREIIGCRLPAVGTDAVPAPALVQRRPAGRRERILTASTALFDERGFYDVRIDDIARASEMSVATLYQHVTGKTQVLKAILERGAEGLLYVTAEALAHATTPDEVLRSLIDTYIRQALGVHGRIMHILAEDLLYLTDDEQAQLRETQREYVAEWMEAICALSGEMISDDARALAQAAISVITDVCQNPELKTRPGLAEQLSALAHAMVLPTGLEPV